LSVHLQTIRLYTTTENLPHADTDTGIELWYFITTTRVVNGVVRVRHGWKSWALDNPWDDRERGQTDMYEIDLADLSDVEQIWAGQPMPQGVPFHTLESVRLAPFYLKAMGRDWWLAGDHALYGRFVELIETAPGGVVDLGWRHLAQPSHELAMSEDLTEGSGWHQIVINGTLVQVDDLDEPMSWLNRGHTRRRG
jgi:hypothetical protein